MPYTTPDDILSYYNGLTYTNRGGADNNISEAESQKFIDEQTAIINLRIGKKYELPITDDDDLTYLKIVNDKLVVCIIDKILRSFAMDDESDMVRRRNACKEAEKMLSDIMDGTIPLNTTQKSSAGFSYNKTTVYQDGCCRQEEVECEDD